MLLRRFLVAFVNSQESKRGGEQSSAEISPKPSIRLNMKKSDLMASGNFVDMCGAHHRTTRGSLKDLPL
jgi:hypothetical protein